MALDHAQESPGGSIFISGGKRFSILWDKRVEKAVQVQSQHVGLSTTTMNPHPCELIDIIFIQDADISGIALFPNYLAYATCCEDGTCKLFDVRAGQELRKLTSQYLPTNGPRGFSSVAFSISGRLVFAGCHDGGLFSWEAISIFLSHSRHQI